MQESLEYSSEGIEMDQFVSYKTGYSIFSRTSCSANQWTGFYMITASVMKGLTDELSLLDLMIRWAARSEMPDLTKVSL